MHFQIAAYSVHIDFQAIFESPGRSFDYRRGKKLVINDFRYRCGGRPATPSLIWPGTHFEAEFSAVYQIPMRQKRLAIEFSVQHGRLNVDVFSRDSIRFDNELFTVLKVKANLREEGGANGINR